MPKIPDCDRCLLYANNPHLICAVHPLGVEDSICLDLRPRLNTEAEELWSPEGTEFINGELKIKREPFYYGCSPVRERLTPQEKLELLDTHPLFTGRCPQCEMPYPQHDSLPVHWDCPRCGWVDDSV